jgi:hypothetical protein
MGGQVEHASMTTNPYQDSARAYWDAGWRGILPLPHGKKTHPPAGATGYDGTDPSWPDICTWADDGPRNIALRLPPGTIGVDVDDYDGKPGAATLTRLVQQHGALPATWLSTSRDDGISGIRIYQVPPGTKLITALPGIEIIQRHHRYIVAQPSQHPSGSTYRWIDERTGEIGGIPHLHDIPDLPPAWVAALTDTGQRPDKDPDADLAAIITALPLGEPCRHVKAAAGNAMTGGARHDNYNKAVLAVLAAGRRGCPGSLAALQRLNAAFRAETTAPGSGQRTPGEADAEWTRNVTGAVQIIAAHPQGASCSDDLAEHVFNPIGTPAGTDPGDDPEYQRRVREKALDKRIDIEARRLAEQALAPDPPAPGAITLDQFLQQPDTPARWRVEGLWPCGGRVLVPAAAKTGKTTLVVRNLLTSLVTGAPFLGRFTTTPTERAVAYLNLEVGADTMRRWLRTSGIDPHARIVIANLRGQASLLDIGTPAGRDKIARWLAQHNTGVVILDPLAPLLAALGLDEDSNHQVAQFFNWWNETLTAAGVDEDLICHHTGHDGQRSRGASRLLDEPDAIWTITRPKPPTDNDDEEGQRLSEHRFIAAAGRDVDLAKSGLQFDPATGRLTLVEGSPAQIRRQMDDHKFEAKVLAAINEAGPEGCSKRHITKRGGMEAKLEAALDRLVRRGTVLVEDLGPGLGSRYWTLFPKKREE